MLKLWLVGTHRGDLAPMNPPASGGGANRIQKYGNIYPISSNYTHICPISVFMFLVLTYRGAPPGPPMRTLVSMLFVGRYKLRIY